MPRSENQKRKLLLLKTYLEQNSDQEHYVSMPELLAYLEAQGIPAERKSVYNDLRLLEDFGCDILRSPGKNGGYAMGPGTFDLPELKLLADAVLSSRFLTEKKSAELLKKLGSLTSRRQAVELRRSMVVSGRVKAMNESVLYNVDALQGAIRENSQISFRYFELDWQKRRVYRPERREASPYGLCWDDANYYLIAYTAQHGITHFRVDKMDDIRRTGVPRVQTEETKRLDLVSYGKRVFSMYNGRTEQVRLRFENELAGVVIDRFGMDLMLIPDGQAHFTCVVEVKISPPFFGWLASFGPRVRILYPDSVAQDFQASLRQTLEAYENP